MPVRNPPHLRLLRDPLVSYVRPFARDFSHTARLVAGGHRVGSGVVVEAHSLARSEDLRKVARDAHMEVILDPMALELSTVGGFQRSGIAGLPWASAEPHAPEAISTGGVRRYADALARAAVDAGATAVLAPTHHLEALPSRWLGTDHELSVGLRDALDRLGHDQVSIYYPLIVKLNTARPGTRRDHLFEQLQKTAASGALDAFWLRIPGFGSTMSGPINLRRYFELARQAHNLGLPIVAERTGTVGLALLAFGAVGGIEQGVTFGDRYDIGTLLRPGRGKGGFLPAPRVYVPEIGAFLPRDRANHLLGHRSVKNRFACQRPCCRRGSEDMIRDPRRHFLVTRAAEVGALSQVPDDYRADHYLETWLRPASDRATMAAKVDPKLAGHRERLDQWRTSLSDLREQDRFELPSSSAVPTGARRVRRGA
jgi:hypothetical protein